MMARHLYLGSFSVRYSVGRAARLPGASSSRRGLAGTGVAPASRDEKGKGKGVLAVWSARLDHARRRAKWYGAVGLAVATTGALVKVGTTTASFFSSIDFFDVAEVSFAAGALTSASVMAGLFATSQMVRLRPEPAFAAAVRALQKDPRVLRALEGMPVPGVYRAYSFVDEPTESEAKELAAAKRAVEQGVPMPPQTAVDRGVHAVRWILDWWRPARLQLMFAVKGGKAEGAHEGMVSAIVEKRRGSLRFLLLTLDVHDTGEHLRLVGEPGVTLYRGVMRLR